MVFGHQPAALGVVNEIAAVDALRVIKIDSGMNPDVGGNPGHLLVFTNPVELKSLTAPRAFSLSILGVLRPLN